MRDLERPTLALWATNLARPIDGIAAWAEAIDAKLAEAAAAGADLLVMPEYAAEQWLTFAPEGLGPTEEIPWLADQAPAALAAIAPLPARHGPALLAGSLPVRIERPRVAGAPPYRNRAHLLLPDGRCIVQDKLCLTPAERDPEAWHLDSGDRLELVTWRGLRLAILVCLDVELPALSARLAPLAPDLLLVPSMTGKPPPGVRLRQGPRGRAAGRRRGGRLRRLGLAGQAAQHQRRRRGGLPALRGGARPRGPRRLPAGARLLR